MKLYIEHQLILSFLVGFFNVDADKTFQRIKFGNTIHLLCQYNGSIEGCSFLIPGEEFKIQLNSSQLQDDNDAKYKYFGMGFDKGECGIQIDNVSIENQGYATCILSLNKTFDLYETIEVKKFDHNNLDTLPTIKILNNSPLIVGQTLIAECATKSERNVKFLWLLNDKVLNETNDATVAVNKKYKQEKNVMHELKSFLKYDLLNSKDNGSILKCRIKFNDNSFKYIDTSLTLEVLNETSNQEPLIGLPYEISIKFFAFPRVLSSRWMVNKRNIYYGKVTNEFSSKELKYLGNNQWNAFLYISNVTEENIHYNYTLQINDSEGTKLYSIRLDDLIKNNTFSLEKKTNNNNNRSSTIKPIKNNSVTTLPEYQRKLKSLSHRRTLMRNSSDIIDNNTTVAPTERKIKLIRKQQQKFNTTKTTSVIISTTTTAKPTTKVGLTSIVLSTDAINKDDTENIKYSIHHIENENYMHNTSLTIDNKYDDLENEVITKSYFENTTFKVYNFTTNKNIDSRYDYTRQIQDYIIILIFVILILVIIIITMLLIHYRYQVLVLKTQIIQMNLENYYNHSCSTFNEYSSNRIGSGFCDSKRPMSNSSDESIINTNSHLYQSIDDIDTHVYDEIISSIDQKSDNESVRIETDEKPNNYENNESFNSINEILIPQHCHSLLTIEEVDEYESSQSQKLSKLETTYI
ncbi:hypothetical protein PVAND_006697 [Polypedilum vanderplanki]|uniref:Ig-like domain-containing protein n=1 Tax=Polypedilum vanderplanki TaxID=319348 RepID=A0A9J6C4S0_POLVA|nr:hypothetical protein PVAND_006697 [Polypedilum vanderplanki]